MYVDKCIKKINLKLRMDGFFNWEMCYMYFYIGKYVPLCYMGIRKGLKKRAIVSIIYFVHRNGLK